MESKSLLQERPGLGSSHIYSKHLKNSKRNQHKIEYTSSLISGFSRKKIKKSPSSPFLFFILLDSRPVKGEDTQQRAKGHTQTWAAALWQCSPIELKWCSFVMLLNSPANIYPCLSLGFL